MKSKNLLVNDKTRGNRMEKCDKTGIKAWLFGRHPEKKRIGNYCPSKEWGNETDN